MSVTVFFLLIINRLDSHSLSLVVAILTAHSVSLKREVVICKGEKKESDSVCAACTCQFR